MYSIPPFLLFLLSIDGSVYFTFVKNKENINMTRRRKDRLLFCTHTLFSTTVCFEREREGEWWSSSCRSFSSSFRLQKNECVDAKDIFFLFLLFRSFVRSISSEVRKRRKARERRENIGSLSLSLSLSRSSFRCLSYAYILAHLYVSYWRSFGRAHVLYSFVSSPLFFILLANTQMDRGLHMPFLFLALFRFLIFLLLTHHRHCWQAALDYDGKFACLYTSNDKFIFMYISIGRETLELLLFLSREILITYWREALLFNWHLDYFFVSIVQFCLYRYRKKKKTRTMKNH